MAVRDNCRHYVGRSTSAGDVIRRCRLSVNEEDPFACPPECLFFEDRAVSAIGWTQAPSEPMSNTADKLAALPPTKRSRKPKAPKPKRKGR
ncbi:MAG: hypothetical protein M3137_20780 [Actinomycetota bacterium]|nr:hypothetical protein [Actinomycetota bacterium]